MTVRVFDADGNERDMEYAEKKYNIVINECSREVDHWELVEVHEKVECAAALVVYLIGPRIAGIPAAFFYEEAEYDSQPGEPKPVKDIKLTNAEGQAGYGMGLGAFYDPRVEHGPHSAWISQPIKGFPSDELDGIGMVRKTNHDHMDPTFEFVEGEEPTPEPEPDGEGITLEITGSITLTERRSEDG